MCFTHRTQRSKTLAWMDAHTRKHKCTHIRTDRQTKLLVELSRCLKKRKLNAEIPLNFFGGHFCLNFFSFFISHTMFFFFLSSTLFPLFKDNFHILPISPTQLSTKKEDRVASVCVSFSFLFQSLLSPGLFLFVNKFFCPWISLVSFFTVQLMCLKQLALIRGFT